MTRAQQSKKMLAAVEQAILDITSGAQSATLSTGTGSKSFTRGDLGKLVEMRNQLRQEIRGYANNGRPAITITGASFA
jgi:hypothetical protein